MATSNIDVESSSDHVEKLCKMATPNIETEIGSDDVEKVCDVCKLSTKTTDAVVYCKTCRQYQCDSCRSMHKIPTLSEHLIIDIEGNEVGKADLDFDMQGIDRCAKHGKRFRFYCRVVNELCCSTCAISYIQKYGAVEEIDSLIDINKDEMQTIKSKIQKQKFTSTVLTSSGSNIKTQLRKNQADKLQKIDQTKDKVIQIFDSFKSEFKTKTDEAISDFEVTVDSEQASRTDIDEQIDTMNTFIDNVACDGNKRQIWTAMNIYNKRIRQIEKQLGQSCEQLRTLNIDFSFNQHLEKLLDMTENIGDITIEKVKLYEPMELQQAAAVDLKPSGEDKEEPLYTGLVFMPEGRVVAVDSENKKCVIMNEQLSVIGQSKLETYPLDVAVMPGNKVAVSSSFNKLSTFTVNQDNTLTKLKTINTTSKLLSLCPLDDKTLLASTIDTEGPAKKVTLKGKETDFDLPWPQSKFAISQSKTTYIPSLDMLMLTDRQAHKCYLWNVKEKTKIVVEDDRIREPMGVCATKSGVIFVCSSANHSIVQISPTGQVLGATRLSVEFPRSVAVSADDKRLLVYNKRTGARKLQLFNIK